jgi:hypothetical protein
VVRHHVAQCAGHLVEFGAPFHSDGFGYGNLHVVYVVAVPYRLKDAVGEAQDHDVLDRLLTQEAVHPIDLRFRQHLEDPCIQLAG